MMMIIVIITIMMIIPKDTVCNIVVLKNRSDGIVPVIRLPLTSKLINDFGNKGIVPL